jgi:hypothetical protein
MRFNWVVVLFACLVATSSGARADSVKELWSRTADREHFQTAKSSLALEMCRGMEMSDWVGPPHVLHGEGETLVTLVGLGGALPTPIGGARILDHGTSREVVVSSKPAWKNRMADAVRKCV